MRGRKVLVVGDLMIDEWIWGTVTRISPEAPVPVVAVSDHSFTLGGAGNVANNLRALGAEVSFCGDGRRRCVRRAGPRSAARRAGRRRSGVFALRGRPTTRKTRVVAHNQQVVRADWESVEPPFAPERARVVAYVARARRRQRRRRLQRLRQGAALPARSSRPRCAVRWYWPIRNRRTSIFSPA